MAANPLIGASDPASKAAAKPSQTVVLVSNVPASQITGIDDFLAAFNKGDVGAQIEPFRYSVSRKARRSIGGKFGKGLSTEVVENVEIKPNEDLFGLRRWLGATRADPSSVLLLNVGKAKDEALAAPLIFSIVFKSGRPVLVSGVDQNTRDQLFAEADLSFQGIPAEVRHNPELAEQLKVRVQRKKGFMATMRNLLDFDFLPEAVKEKVNKVNAGADPTDLSEAEVVNLLLLADLASRYQHVLTQFKTAYGGGTAPMNQLVSMFELLLADLPVNQTINAFKGFLGEEGQAALKAGKITSKSVMFGYVHQHLNKRDGSSRSSKEDPKGDFLKALASVVVRHRSRVDPFLWKRCSFLGNFDAGEKSVVGLLEPLEVNLNRVLAQKPEEPPAEIVTMLGREMFDLVKLAGSPREAMQSPSDFARVSAAARMLPVLATAAVNPQALLDQPEQYKEVMASEEALVAHLRQHPPTMTDLKKISGRLHATIHHHEAIVDQVRRATLDVIAAHARERETILRKIYIVKALPELTKFSFHLGDQGLTNVERICGLSILRARFGLEVDAKPTHADSIGLFESAGTKPLGTLENDPEMLSHAYTELMALQVESQVRRMVDKKINYLQSTFGDNFFEVIYDGVVRNLDLPLSTNQFATIVRQRGILGSLETRGWKQEQEDSVMDPFLTFEALDSRHKDKAAYPQRDNFERDFKANSAKFSQMLNELKASAESDPREDNPRRIIWQLFKRGVYNLGSEDAKAEFRKTPFYERLKEFIVKVSSENYSIFSKDTEQGVKIYVPRKYEALTILGSRFSFLVENKVVRYQLLVTPVDKAEELDPISRVFLEALDAVFEAGPVPEEYRGLVQATEDIRRSEAQWHAFSHYLAFGMLDRVLGDTVLKQLIPGKIGPPNLFYLPDHTKLCLGPALTAGAALPFAKILQKPENMGNIQKNPRSSSTTIDDFAIEVHKIGRLFDELSNVRGICEDLLDILQNLSHDRSESAHVARYEQALQRLVKGLSKPVRHLQEEDVQKLHEAARSIRDVLRALYHGESSSRTSVTNMLQAQLQARRSDGHQLKLSVTDAFIIDKTEIKVMQKVRKDGEVVGKRQRRMEVEVDAAHQTLISRMREVMNTQKILAGKRHVVFSPEGQKKKQIQYVLDIIDVLQDLRGSAITFYVDRATLDDAQEQALATRVKPHLFFDMNQLTPTPPEGMNVTEERDPLSGKTKVVSTGGDGAAEVPPADAPTETIYRCAKAENVEYRLDHATGRYAFRDQGRWVPARAFPVDLGQAGSSVILMARLTSGKIQFHGLMGNEVLLPDAGLRGGDTICGFHFLDRVVRVVKEDGKPVVQVEQRNDGFLDELRNA